MFDTLTPPEHHALTNVMLQAAQDTLAEVAGAVRMGRDAFDFAYGPGAALGFVGMALDQVYTLSDLALITPTATS